jgi:CheY-like chemotaxis protein
VNKSPELRILVAEDDDLLRTVLSKILEAQGHRVTTRSCGLRTLRTLQERPFDLLLVDLHLPGMSGQELVHTIQDTGINVPILVMSGSDYLEPWVRGLPFLFKPFTTAQLFSKLDQMFSSSRAQVS